MNIGSNLSSGGGASSGTDGARGFLGVEAALAAAGLVARGTADRNALAACSLRFSGLERVDVAAVSDVDTEKISHTLNGLWEIVTEIVWGRQPQGMGVLLGSRLRRLRLTWGIVKKGLDGWKG